MGEIIMRAGQCGKHRREDCEGCQAAWESNDHRLQAKDAEIERLREALTPSGDTKAAYHGEFAFNITETVFDEEADAFDELSRKVYVPWTTVKEIMAAIRQRADTILNNRAQTPSSENPHHD